MKIYRVYPNGHIKDQTHVLWPHKDPEGNQCEGYDGDINAWSEHNQKVRPGCTQVLVENNCPFVLYMGLGMTNKVLKEFFNKIRK